MKYRVELTHPAGFRNGAAIPADATVYRQVLVRLFNALADKLSYSVRMCLWDRPARAPQAGCNTCMILCVPPAFLRQCSFDGMGLPLLDCPVSPVLLTDEQFRDRDMLLAALNGDPCDIAPAVLKCLKRPDDYVVTKPTVDKCELDRTCKCIHQVYCQ